MDANNSMKIGRKEKPLVILTIVFAVLIIAMTIWMWPKKDKETSSFNPVIGISSKAGKYNGKSSFYITLATDKNRSSAYVLIKVLDERDRALSIKAVDGVENTKTCLLEPVPLDQTRGLRGVYVYQVHGCNRHILVDLFTTNGIYRDAGSIANFPTI